MKIISKINKLKEIKIFNSQLFMIKK